MKPYRATGRPRVRPSTLPFDIDEQILSSLKWRMDPKTHLVSPDWKGMTHELHVSRTTISRIAASLKRSGFFESIYLPVRPGSRIKYTLYRITDPRDDGKPPSGV